MRKWNYEFDVPDQKKVRMLVYTDAKNEADDQFTIAHHLMTPKFIVKGIIAAHFDRKPRQDMTSDTAQESFDEVNRILNLMDIEGVAPVAKGSIRPLVDENTPNPSEGAKLIIEEAMKDDPHPLYIGCQGSITDLASAILMEPRIQDRMTAIWIGGGDYPEGGPEFNLMMDPTAANVVLKSRMPLWQVTKSAYKQMSVTLAMLQKEVRPYGKIGKYLFEQMVKYNSSCADHPEWPHGESWGLGDSPTVGLLLIEQEKQDIFEMRPAPEVRYEDFSYNFAAPHRQIRVYKDVNPRLTLEDFFAKLQINYPENV
ncbi:MAG TPA: nucleoside hydrolase [Lachnospiraceae bacterium]|nr:nucleoside hydrolase [Lachnospiraceae bacterium]